MKRKKELKKERKGGRREEEKKINGPDSSTERVKKKAESMKEREGEKEREGKEEEKGGEGRDRGNGRTEKKNQSHTQGDAHARAKHKQIRSCTAFRCCCCRLERTGRRAADDDQDQDKFSAPLLRISLLSVPSFLLFSLYMTMSRWSWLSSISSWFVAIRSRWTRCNNFNPASPIQILNSLSLQSMPSLMPSFIHIFIEAVSQSVGSSCFVCWRISFSFPLFVSPLPTVVLSLFTFFFFLPFFSCSTSTSTGRVSSYSSSLPKLRPDGLLPRSTSYWWSTVGTDRIIRLLLFTRRQCSRLRHQWRPITRRNHATPIGFDGDDGEGQEKRGEERQGDQIDVDNPGAKKKKRRKKEQKERRRRQTACLRTERGWMMKTDLTRRRAGGRERWCDADWAEARSCALQQTGTYQALLLLLLLLLATLTTIPRVA